MTDRPQRRPTDHYHPDMWTRAEQYRHEEMMGREIAQLEVEVARLKGRLTLMLGGLGLLAFVLPILAPIMWQLLNISVPSR